MLVVLLEGHHVRAQLQILSPEHFNLAGKLLDRVFVFVHLILHSEELFTHQVEVLGEVKHCCAWLRQLWYARPILKIKRLQVAVDMVDPILRAGLHHRLPALLRLRQGTIESIKDALDLGRLH